MNKLLRNVLIIAAFLAFAALAVSFLMRKKTTQLSPQAKVEFEEAGLKLKVVYCQPSKKERLIFGSSHEGALQPYGKYWRLGANEATTLRTNEDLLIDGKVLVKGTYSLYAIPGKEIWTFGFNSEANRWGASEPDYTKDVFTVEAPVYYTEEIQEQFTVFINTNEIVFWWDKSKTIVPYKVVN